MLKQVLRKSLFPPKKLIYSLQGLVDNPMAQCPNLSPQLKLELIPLRNVAVKGLKLKTTFLL